MRAIPNFQLVWATLPVNVQQGATVQFPDVPELRGRKIIAVEFYDETFLTNTPDLVACVGPGDMAGLTVVLKDASSERIQDIPVTTLQPTFIAGIYKQVVPFSVNWQSSFVRVVGAAVTGGRTVPLGIMYE